MIIKDIFNNDGDIIKRYMPQVRHKITEVSEKTFDILHKGLYRVVNEPKGTAYWFRGKGIEMSGKTGTSQVIGMTSKQLFSKCEDMPYKERHHGIFASFAPAYNPRIAVAVVVEHGCHGSSAAAPVARDITTKYMQKYHPEEYERNLKNEKEKTIRLKKLYEQREKRRVNKERRLKVSQKNDQ
jgi:penicillin-binding protein 2